MTKFKVGDRVGWSYSNKYEGTVKEVIENSAGLWSTYVGVLWDHDATRCNSKHPPTDLVLLSGRCTPIDWQGWRELT